MKTGYDRRMEKLIHYYYGNGKGKTTAAIGLAVRCAGAGYRVYFCQFLKGNDTSELSILRTVPNLSIHRPQKKYPFTRNMTETDRQEIAMEHSRILGEIEEAAASLAEDVRALIILDEIGKAWSSDLVEKQRVLALLSHRRAEYVLTGRDLVPELLALADYVTEFTAIRHPYQKGIRARLGIEY